MLISRNVLVSIVGLQRGVRGISKFEEICLCRSLGMIFIGLGEARLRGRAARPRERSPESG